MGQGNSSGRMSPISSLPQRNVKEKRRSSTRSLPSSVRLVGPTATNFSRSKTSGSADGAAWWNDSAPYHLGNSDVSYRRGPRSLDIQPTTTYNQKSKVAAADSNWSDVASDIVCAGRRGTDGRRRVSSSRREPNDRYSQRNDKPDGQWLRGKIDEEMERRRTTRECPEILEVSCEEADPISSAPPPPVDLYYEEKRSQQPRRSQHKSSNSRRKTQNVLTQTTEDAESVTTKLKQLESDNKRLSRENERQKREYDQMLDAIEKKVLKALLQQKTLKAECLRLRTALSKKPNCSCGGMFNQKIVGAGASRPLGQQSDYFDSSAQGSLLSVNSLVTTAAAVESPMINAGEQLCSRPQSFNFDAADSSRLTSVSSDISYQEYSEGFNPLLPILPFGSAFTRLRLQECADNPLEMQILTSFDQLTPQESVEMLTPVVSAIPLETVSIADDGYSTMRNQISKELQLAFSQPSEAVEHWKFPSIVPRATRSLTSLNHCPGLAVMIRSLSDSYLLGSHTKGPGIELLGDADEVEYAMFKGFADMEGHGCEAMAEAEYYEFVRDSAFSDQTKFEDEFDSIYETIQGVRSESTSDMAFEVDTTTDCVIKEKNSAANSAGNLSPTLQLWATQLGWKDDKCDNDNCGPPKVVRYTAGGNRRPTIMKRSVFYPFGRMERAALANFEFLNSFCSDSSVTSLNHLCLETDRYPSLSPACHSSLPRSRSLTNASKNPAVPSACRPELSAFPTDSQSPFSSYVSMEPSCSSSLFLSDFQPEDEEMLSSSGSSLSFHMPHM